jgi:hypothetical protein
MRSTKYLGVVIIPLCAIFAVLATATFSSGADDAKVAKKPYPLTTCIVSGDKLGGDMGDPYVYIYKDKAKTNDPGREIKFCCKSCVPDFEKEPAKYLKKLDEAEAAAKTKK